RHLHLPRTEFIRRVPLRKRAVPRKELSRTGGSGWGGHLRDDLILPWSSIPLLLDAASSDWSFPAGPPAAQPQTPPARRVRDTRAPPSAGPFAPAFRRCSPRPALAPRSRRS